MLPFGLRDGLLVSVNDVERGLQENVVCPSCQVQLIARKGKVKTHHFAHHNGADCLTGLETVLHMRAKEIIEEAKSIFIPEHSIKLPGRRNVLNIITPQKIILDEVWLEKRLDKIIPDVFAKTLGKDLLIEIRVSHAVEQSKLEHIKRMNLRAIEVNLSDFHDKGYDEEVLRERLIERHVRKKWLSSPKINGVTEDVIMENIYNTCSQLRLSSLCPASEGSGRIRLPFFGGECYSCEYYFGYYKKVACCGYNEKIKDYDSLQQSVRRKRIQPGAVK